jgi:hypothetical protein
MLLFYTRAPPPIPKSEASGMSNPSDTSDRFERALKRTEQLATIIITLSIAVLILLFA